MRVPDHLHAQRAAAPPLVVCTGCDPADANLLVAVGPEGGWVEPDELQFLESFGFQV